MTQSRGQRAAGFWVATRATTATPVPYKYTSQTTSGPDKGRTQSGTLELLGDSYGGLIGFLHLSNGVIEPVSGQLVNGTVNMQIIVRSGTPFVVVGTAQGASYVGKLAGPLAGDHGSWSAQQEGAALPRILAAAQISSLPMLSEGATPTRAAPSTATHMASPTRAAADGTQTFHFAGTLLPTVGAPLLHLNGILSLQPNPATGSFNNHATLLLSDGREFTSLSGSLHGKTLNLSFTDGKLQIIARGTVVGGNRISGVFIDQSGVQTQGFWAATRATTASLVHYTYTSQTTAGPDAGHNLSGTLDVLGDTYGGLIGFLHVSGGTVYPVSGQLVNGTVNMQIIVRSGTPFFVVGAASGTGYSGDLAGPLAGDQGTWSAQRS